MALTEGPVGDNDAKGNDVGAILWGGPKGPGLVFTVANLAEAIDKLSLIVSDPDAGLVIGFKTARRDIDDNTRDIGTIKGMVQKVLYGLAGVGLITLVPATKTILGWFGH